MVDILIRNMQPEDCEVISLAFKEQGWNKPVKQYRNYLSDQNAGVRLVLILFTENFFAGYLTILWKSGYKYFFECNIPEITDLNILKNIRIKNWLPV